MVHTIQRAIVPLGISALILGMFTVSLADKPDPPEQQILREALEGKETEKSGDGVLDDVLDIIKKRGSILDGSALDDRTDETVTASADASRNAMVAEQLLKTSRLLQSIGGQDKMRVDLVKRMRTEAARLLSE